MRNITMKAYRFGELDERAKERVRSDFASQAGFTRADEYLASLRALALHFGGKLTDWNVDWAACSHSSAKFSMPDDTSPEAIADIGRLLDNLGSFDPETGKGHGDCKLTGYCYDECAIDGFRVAYRQGERDLDKLMQAAFRTWLKAAQEDAAWETSDEGLTEHFDANETEFDVYGRIIAESN